MTTYLASNVVTDSIPKLTRMTAAVAVFFAVLLLIFFTAGRATGRFRRPTTVAVFVAPMVILLIAGLVIPAVRTLYFSFYDASGNNYVGVDNYTWAFTDPGMHTVLLNTVIWIFVAPLVSTGLGLLLAILIDRMKRESVAKSLIFMPMAISFVGASIIWKFVYDYRSPGQSQIGLLNAVALKVGWSHPPNWLLSWPLNTILLIVIMVWVQTGFAMVVLSAAIKAIPADVMEAAALDGAKGWRLFSQVTVPMIRGTLVVVLTTIMIAVLKIFDIVRTMTGGNFKTSVLANEMYSQSFVQADFGHGSALAIVLFVGVVPLIVYNIRILRKERAVR